MSSGRSDPRTLSMAPKQNAPKGAKTAMPVVVDAKASFTPESFEEELKALAAKAKTETWAKWASGQASVYATAATLLSLAAVSANASQLALSPVYGALPAALWHKWVLGSACFVGWSANLFLYRSLPFKPQLLLPIIAIYVPMVQFFLGRLSWLLGVHLGPLVTEMVTMFPLVTVSVACVATALERLEVPQALPEWMADAAPGLGSYTLFMGAEFLSGNLIMRYIGKSFLVTRMGLEIAVAACYSLWAPSKMLLYALPALLHTAYFNTHVPTFMALDALNQTLHAEKWAILDRRESITGYISVVESLDESMRAMRCDHSILGGEWRKHRGKQVAEPIFGIFVMLEAIRLVEVTKPVPDSEAKALVIGLGIGTLPGALIEHGIDTTIVEIDPVVHEFALKYFGLQHEHTPVIEDAVSYASRVAKESMRFDYIVHDVFTGGAEPIPLFTLEFLQDLHTMLTPDGVIAINYAGDFAMPSSKVVVQTIRTVFPSCRIFREYPRDEEGAKAGHDFSNVVIFCTKHAGRPVRFRNPTQRDRLSSKTRDQFLVPDNEVFDSEFLARKDLGILTRNDTRKLVKYHEKSAVGHWGVMRTVMPSIVWENW